MEKYILRFGSRFFGLSGRITAILVFLCVGLGITLGLVGFVRKWEGRLQQTEFDYASEPYIEAIRKATESIQLTHEVMRQNFYGSHDVSREEFSLCSAPCLARLPSLKVLQWAPRVPEADREAFVEQARREGWPNYQIVEPNPQGKLIPAEIRKDYYPIWYAASKCGFEAVFGWDFAADPRLLAAIDECRDLDQFTISQRINLSKIGFSPLVIQTFLPLYSDYQNVHTTAERRSHFKGLLVGLCQLDDLVNCALRYEKGHQGIDLALIDESAPPNRQLLYYHASRTRTGENRSQENLANVMKADEIFHKQTLKFGGREWSLVCIPAPQFYAAHTRWRSWAVLVVGMMATFLSAAYVWSAATRTAYVEKIVAERSVDLCKKDELLRQALETKARAIRTAHEETIFRLVAASMCRDEETGMHIRRTGLLSEALDRVAGWTEAEAEILRLAAPMHDVGKIGIPDAILQKPGKLTAKEYTIMKTHTTIGARMLEGSQSEILIMARDIALCHHERWDGDGYPRGLTGMEIPEPARIVAIVDVFDAISHDRVYRAAMSEEEVTEIMVAGGGKHFDPILLAVFLEHYEEMWDIIRENPDEEEKEEEIAAKSLQMLGVPIATGVETEPAGAPV